MSASSRTPSSSSSPEAKVRDTSLSQKSHPNQPDDVPASEAVLLAAHHSPGTHAISPTSPSSLQQSSEHLHPSTSAPESDQHLDLGPRQISSPIPRPGSNAEQPQRLDNLVQADKETPSPTAASSLLSIPPQLSSIRTPLSASSPQDSVVAAEASHSLSDDVPTDAHASADAPSIPQLHSMQSEGLATISQTDLAPEFALHDTSSVTSADEQLQARSTVDAKQTSPSTLQKTSSASSAESEGSVVLEPPSMLDSTDAASDAPGSLAGTDLSSEADPSPRTESSPRPALIPGTASPPASPDFASPTSAHQLSSPDAETKHHADTSQQSARTPFHTALQPNATPHLPGQRAHAKSNPSPEASDTAAESNNIPGTLSTASDSPHLKRQESNSATSPSGRDDTLLGTHGHAQRRTTRTGNILSCMQDHAPGQASLMYATIFKHGYIRAGLLLNQQNSYHHNLSAELCSCLQTLHPTFEPNDALNAFSLLHSITNMCHILARF